MTGSERTCRGPDCGVNLIHAFDTPPNGYGYWCSECLLKHVLDKSFLCHDCGAAFHTEPEIQAHSNKEHIRPLGWDKR